MRMFGLLGLITLLGIAFIFSGNRRHIRLRTVIWGVALQFLLAIIVLPANWHSWAAMYIFLYLVLLYMFKDSLTKEKGVAPLLALLLAGSIMLATLSFLLASIGLGFYFLGALVTLCLLQKLTSRVRHLRYSLGAVLAVSLGILVQRGLYGQHIFAVLAEQITGFLKLADIGSVFLFGNLANPDHFDTFGYQFAFTVLPIIIFFSAIIAILYHLGVMQAVVEIMAKFMHWTMGTSGAETLSCSANVFVGQTEAPFLIRPFLETMTISELHAVMTGGFATIAGSVLAGYIGMGISARHLIAASILSAPAALVMAKILLPETEQPLTSGYVAMPEVKKAANLLDAAASGITAGLKLALNVAAMLIAFKALIGLVDVMLSAVDKLLDGGLLGNAFNESRGEFRGIFPGSLKVIFGWLFSPLALAMGVPWHETADVGNLLGVKISATEFVAYADLSVLIKAGALSPRSVTIATYALCGFANFASIGIQLGGIGALAPGRRSDLARVAFRAMCAGALASWMTATIAGLLL